MQGLKAIQDEPQSKELNLSKATSSAHWEKTGKGKKESVSVHCKLQQFMWSKGLLLTKLYGQSAIPLLLILQPSSSSLCWGCFHTVSFSLPIFSPPVFLGCLSRFTYFQSRMHACKTQVQIQIFPCDTSHWVNNFLLTSLWFWATGSGFQSSDILDVRFVFPRVSRHRAAGTGIPTQEDLQGVWSSSQRKLSHTAAAGTASASLKHQFLRGTFLLWFLMSTK